MVWMIFIKILKKQIIAIAFGDIAADMLSNKKLNLIVTELYIKGRKLNISFAFYHSITLYFTKKYWTKFWTLFCYETSK